MIHFPFKKGGAPAAGSLSLSFLLAAFLFTPGCDDADDAPIGDATLPQDAAESSDAISSDASTDAQADASTDSDAESDASTDSDATLDASTETDASTDASTETDASTDASTETDASGDASTDIDAESDASTDTDASTDGATGCPENTYGSDCKPCECDHGVCFAGPGGNGKCTECEAGYYGEYCDQAVDCEHGTANEGIAGNGKCSKCDDAHYFGEYCRPVSCVHGLPKGGINGDGKCSFCNDANYFGENCDQQKTCVNGLTNGGINGDGRCISCNSANDFGENCDQKITCVYGTPSSGISGDGKCLPDSCQEGWAGVNCNQCATEACQACTRPFGVLNAEASHCSLTEKRDGQTETYQIVQIGDQTWMAENYRRQLPDGSSYVNGSSANDPKYGLLYDSYAVNAEDFCPEGWHLPSEEEWSTLFDATLEPLISITAWNHTETILDKSCTRYNSEEPFGTNESGFGALYSGSYDLLTAQYQMFPKDPDTPAAFYWTADNTLVHINYTQAKFINPRNLEPYTLHYSLTGAVRCLKDYECPAGRFGKQCKLCTCQNGSCDDGLDGTGTCTEPCDENHFGPNCEPCTCQNDSCDDGLDGTGTCTEPCDENHFGPNCEPCTCNTEHGICNDRLTGNGTCFACLTSGWAIPNCDFCSDMYYGPSCTSEYGLFEDPRDHSVYRTVQIGDQTWMAENLHFKDRVSYYHSYGDAANDAVFGLLYDDDTVLETALCPPGWHIPSKAEFETLTNYIDQNRSMSENNFLNLIADSGEWKYFNRQGTDEFGFRALPAGYYYLRSHKYRETGEEARFWTSTTSRNALYILTLNGQSSQQTGSATVSIRSDYDVAQSVRCLQGESTEPQVERETCLEHYGPDCTEDYETFEDPRDHKIYKKIRIGNQIWMAENLRYKQEGDYVHVNDERSNDAIYGLLYKGESIRNGNLCPPGWTLPSRTAFATLQEYVSQNKTENESDFLALIARTKKWTTASEQGVNEFGFNALPSGTYKASQEVRRFIGFGRSSVFWTSTGTGNHNTVWAYVLEGDALKTKGYNLTEDYIAIRCIQQ